MTRGVGKQPKPGQQPEGMTRRRALRFIVPGTALAAAPMAASLIGDAAAAEAATTAPAPVLYLTDYGAKGDGTTDDTAALQSAIAAAGSAGEVVAPAGTYAISSRVTVPD